MRTTVRRAAMIAVGALVAATTGAAGVGDRTGGSPDGRPPSGRVHGSARLAYPDPTHDVRFTVDATVSYPAGTADPMGGVPGGTARISHHAPNAAGGPVTIWARIAVDCVVTGGGVATITGEVVDADPRSRAAGWLRQRFGFSVADDGGGRPDRVGWSGPQLRNVPGRPDDPVLRRCMAPAPFLAVRSGGYTVVDATP